MNKKTLELNITGEEISFFHRYLGYGNPIDSKYWFIGNELQLNKRKNETPFDRINILKFEKHNYFGKYFTTDFGEYNSSKLFEGYKFIHNHYGKLEKYFLGDLFFLPSLNYKSLSGIYLKKSTELNNKNSRLNFYESCGLIELLQKRIIFLFSLLNEDSNKKIHIYSYKHVKENFDFLKKTLGLGQIEKWIEKDNHCIFFYKGNHITLSDKIKK